MRKPYSLLPKLTAPQNIEDRIFLIRGQRVMLDSDLAEIYHVPTRRLNEQVRRNRQRFPEDFMFQLTRQEFTILMSQFATSRWGGRRKLPYAFTEHGAVMLASVLNSKVAIAASIHVVRAFVRFRSILSAHKLLANKIVELEKKYDKKFLIVFDVIKRLMLPPEDPAKSPIGFTLTSKRQRTRKRDAKKR